jgi:hypothetical protein
MGTRSLASGLSGTDPSSVGFKEVFLSYRALIASARATMMVAGTAATVGVALANGRRLTPVFVEASPALRPQAAALPAPVPLALPDPRRFFARRFALATLLALAGIVAVAAIAAAVSFSVPQSSSAAVRPTFGPGAELRAASGIGSGFEQSYASSSPSADAVGGMLLAAAQERYAWDVLRAMKQIDEQRHAQAAAAAAPVADARNPARSYNGASGYAPGTVISARITIYGCTGPGGGFCNHMASGIAVYEGAAACSGDLPFGTKLKIVGDPTGRVYECLDRGALAATWIDVFFYNTSDGIAWQSTLGGTVANIEIVN